MRFVLQHGSGEGVWFRGGMSASLKAGEAATRIDPASEGDLKDLADGGWIELTDLRPGESRPPVEYWFSLSPKGVVIANAVGPPLIDFAEVATGRRFPQVVSRRVIGEEISAAWWEAIPPTVPAVVRVAAVRARAVDELRGIQDDLQAVIPEASGLERRMLEVLVRGPRNDIIDTLVAPELAETWEVEGPRMGGLINLLVAATRIISGVVGWAEAPAYIQKAIEILAAG